MPMMPAISRIVVLPNHIRKFIEQISVRTVTRLAKKSMGISLQPQAWISWFTGPTLEKSVKKSMEKAEAMIRFGM